MWPFKWKLLSSTFLWYCLLCWFKSIWYSLSAAHICVQSKTRKKNLTIPDFVFSHAFNPLDAYRSHVEYTVGRSFEIGFISMSITSQLQYLGVSWEMQIVHIGTIIKPHSTQYSLTLRFQIDKITVRSTNTYSCINSWLRVWPQTPY